MEIGSRKQLFQKVREFNEKRRMHDKIVEELVYGYSTSQTSSSRTHQQNLPHYPLQPITSTIPKPPQPQHTNRSNMSNMSKISKLSRQVNLDTYLHNHTPLSSHPQSHPITKPTLKSSLSSLYPTKPIKIPPKPTTIKNTEMISENMVDFPILVNYLQDNQLWEEVFQERDGIFYGNLYMDGLGHCGRVVLDGDLGGDQVGLVLDDSVHYTGDVDDADSDGSQQGAVCIGYLLLHRLISYLGTGYAPHVFQSIFGYPYKTYNLHNTQSYLNLTKTLPSLNHPHPHHPSSPNSHLLLFGKSLLNSKLTPLKPDNFTQQNLPNLLKKYKEIIVINQVKEVCVKAVSVVQRRNHHSVVDLENVGDSSVEIWGSFLEMEMEDDRQQGEQRQGRRYRYCLVGEDGEIVQYSQPDIPTRQCFTLKLASNSQYKLYISTLSRPSSPTSHKFSLILQSQSPLSSVLTSIKFNESYNIMTQTIINRYLTDFVQMDQIEKEMIRISHFGDKFESGSTGRGRGRGKEVEGEGTVVVIVRVWLGIMGMGVDFVVVQDGVGDGRRKLKGKEREAVTKFQVEYQDQQVLCDRQYKQNRKKILNSQPQIHQIYLSKKSKIKSCSGLKFITSQLIL